MGNEDINRCHIVLDTKTAEQIQFIKINRAFFTSEDCVTMKLEVIYLFLWWIYFNKFNYMIYSNIHLVQDHGFYTDCFQQIITDIIFIFQVEPGQGKENIITLILWQYKNWQPITLSGLCNEKLWRLVLLEFFNF